MFNADSEHDWVHYPSPPSENFFPRKPKGLKIRELSMPVEKVRFSEPSIKFVAIEDRFVGQVSKKERSYFIKNFFPTGCLWERIAPIESLPHQKASPN